MTILSVFTELRACNDINEAAAAGEPPKPTIVQSFTDALGKWKTTTRDLRPRSYVEALAWLHSPDARIMYLDPEHVTPRTFNALLAIRGSSGPVLAVRISTKGEEQAEQIRALRKLGVEGFLCESCSNAQEVREFLGAVHEGNAANAADRRFAGVVIATSSAASAIEGIAANKDRGLDLLLVDSPNLLNSVDRSGRHDGATPTAAYQRYMEQIAQAARRGQVTLGARVVAESDIRERWEPQGYKHFAVSPLFDGTVERPHNPRLALGLYLEPERKIAQSSGKPVVIQIGHREPLIAELARAINPPVSPIAQQQQQPQGWRRLPDVPTAVIAAPVHETPANSESILLAKTGGGSVEVDGTSYPLKQGDLVAIPRGKRVTVTGAEFEKIY